MIRNINKYYPLKVWALTVVIAPLIIFIFTFFGVKGKIEGVGVILFMEILIFCGGLYSIPTFLLCYIIFYLTKNRIHSILNMKMLFISLAIILLTITNYLFWGPYKYCIHYDSSGLITTIAYCLAVLIVGILCKIELPVIKENPAAKKPWDY